MQTEILTAIINCVINTEIVLVSKYFTLAYPFGYLINKCNVSISVPNGFQAKK